MIKPRQDPVSIDEVLENVFWSHEKISYCARQLLEYIAQRESAGDPMQASEWKSFCEQREWKQSQYTHIIRGLRGAGIIEKRNREFRVVLDFSRYLVRNAEIMERWITRAKAPKPALASST